MIYKKYTYTYQNVLNGTVYIIKVFGLSFFLFFTLRDGFKFVYIYSSNIEISGVDGGQSVGRVGEGVWSGNQDLLSKKDAPHPQHFVSLRIISFWINRDCTLQEVQLSLSAMLKGGYKPIDFSEDNIFLLFSLRFRGYETHHKTPLLIYLGIKTVLKKTTKTETLDLNQIWVYIEHNLGVVVVFWFFWYLYHNERLKLHCKRAHLFVSYFVFFFQLTLIL